MKNRLITAMVIGGVLMAGCSKTNQAAAGSDTFPLKDCPDRPNCVSSIARNQARYVAPFAYACDRRQAIDVLVQILAEQPRTTIVEKREDYLHVEFRSRIFRFVDDVEFYFPADQPLVHVRSASRLGYSDMGVNRKRVEALRANFSEALKKRS
ncbi:DUF1499 domain-containing protein [Desulfosarcina widdelii]|nr:DUF1499 domain-containing protein [Desulfosarcina widdelii]